MEREWLIGQQIDKLAGGDGDVPGTFVARLWNAAACVQICSS